MHRFTTLWKWWANIVSSTVSTRRRKLLAVAAWSFAECVAAGGSASAPAATRPAMNEQFSQQRVDNLALLCLALRLRHLEAL